MHQIYVDTNMSNISLKEYLDMFRGGFRAVFCIDYKRVSIQKALGFFLTSLFVVSAVHYAPSVA